MANFIFIISCFVCVSIVAGKEQCSPFHYHEQLLEKMIEVKYKVGIYAENMEKWEKVLNEKMSRLNEKLGQQEQLERQLASSVESQLSNVRETLRKELLDVQGDTWTQQILFRAREPKNQPLSKGDTIVFEEIVQSEGDGYDNKTGIFTAPVTGTYLFTTQFCLRSPEELAVNIVANGKAITAASFGDGEWSYIGTSTDGVAFLSAGDEVKVRVTFLSSRRPIYKDSAERYWSYFSGVLLHR